VYDCADAPNSVDALATFVITAPLTILLGVISNWISNRFSEKTPKNITINNINISGSSKDIKLVINQTIKETCQTPIKD